MKAWIKGVILGAVWGLVSNLLYFSFRFVAESSSIVTIPLWVRIVGLPATIGMDWISGYIGMKQYLLPLIIGPFVGSIIGYVIGKYRERVEK